jgi:hypothetical protein
MLEFAGANEEAILGMILRGIGRHKALVKM